MPLHEGIRAVSEHRRDDETKPDEATVERLRAAVRDEELAASDEPVDADLVWRAVSGELPVEERKAVVARVADDPAWAAAWRLALELTRAAREAEAPERPEAAGPHARRPADEARERRRFRFAWSRPMLGAAATAALALVVVGVAMREDTLSPRLRGADPSGLVSQVPEDAPLKREDCVLRWSGGPAGTRWSVRLSTEDLSWVHRADSLEQSEYRVPASVLAPLESGTKLLWQVEARLPDGQVLRGITFVNRLE
ncbi:hypothetical protein FJV41_06905 [Myxococcus llanfairpwllgwyngyllgogerychwyrndrobwllllantysiliogogogochensis]|uniref:Anti-sigma factor n=1 Tax=Myxococcus llanfairpwllgwyngyllgogerychwyrndrobwllllantysiliogogogochensis TaxID=2590453 RepID=A0A540X680_9BACT|nr:hypothetical protein FJV41_06905 [Myxococcus llanfairpwllgwyngyllgogerychwyrndrobwllllantysiliogogogochensis]